MERAARRWRSLAVVVFSYHEGRRVGAKMVHRQIGVDLGPDDCHYTCDEVGNH